MRIRRLSEEIDYVNKREAKPVVEPDQSNKMNIPTEKELEKNKGDYNKTLFNINKRLLKDYDNEYKWFVPFEIINKIR